MSHPQGPTIIIRGDNLTNANQDAVTNALTFLQHPHQQIHDGVKYVASDIVTLTQGALKKYLLITPNTAIRVHMLYGVASTAQGQVQFFETPTVNANGNAMTLINQNRNSTNTATLQIFADPTIGANGTQLIIEETGSGKATPGFTSADRNEHEFNLKQNTNYLLLETATQATDFETHFHWYEV